MLVIILYHSKIAEIHQITALQTEPATDKWGSCRHISSQSLMVYVDGIIWCPIVFTDPGITGSWTYYLYAKTVSPPDQLDNTVPKIDS